ncbi:MAG: rhodanese-like domain-containing protein [Sulfobacillus thermosulfidooxidans]|uniref:Rhodanese domain-containing protein n=1 Tax=Sulfobacillus thermotolerans TaxID=338644 RepID=A0ABM6RQJ1_9FIRM|nr:hypothetical protein BXT84_06375 [Sulfobacillus thermotolerans]MCY0907047.1 rhodanese-like domain-containing protein [Sulfobacillus thermotolerans]PSR36847.1 MAG: rhodanese-like domain-containing protein [Sulfobacillus thermosulfidooxidans]
MNLLNLFRHPPQLRDLTPQDLDNFIHAQDPVVIDVRTPTEYQAGHLPKAVLAPLGTTLQHITHVDHERPVVLICKTGHRSQAAAWELLAEGFTHVYHLKGGMDHWKKYEKSQQR